jgi:tetratricopeptide (TPR) repeat protein
MFEQYRHVFHGHNNAELNSQKKMGLTELNNNSKCFNNKNMSQQQQQQQQASPFGNEVTLKLVNKNNSSGKGNSSKKLVNDKNNNNEENHANARLQQQLQQQDQQNVKAKSKALAIKGNELAKQGEFERAIDKYAEAINVDPSDHRLYVNRSYCHEKLSHFYDALYDANRAIILDPTWPKSYFRKGRALVGLKVIHFILEKSFKRRLIFNNFVIY